MNKGTGHKHQQPDFSQKPGCFVSVILIPHAAKSETFLSGVA